MLFLSLKRIAFLFVGLVFLFNGVESLTCGTVFDGDQPDVELDFQDDHHSLSFNFDGFDGHDSLSKDITYQYSMISDQLATNDIFESGSGAPPELRCRTNVGINATPDVVLWTTVNGDLNPFIVTQNGLELRTGHTYYVLLRITSTKQQLYTNTDGVFIRGNGTIIYVHDDDDDHSFADWKIGLIAAGCAVFCLLLLLLLLLLVAKGKGEDKYTTTVHRNDNVDKV